MLQVGQRLALQDIIQVIGKEISRSLLHFETLMWIWRTGPRERVVMKGCVKYMHVITVGLIQLVLTVNKCKQYVPASTPIEQLTKSTLISLTVHVHFRKGKCRLLRPTVDRDIGNYNLCM